MARLPWRCACFSGLSADACPVCPGITSLEPLAACSRLCHLYAASNKVGTLAPLSGLFHLRTVSLYCNLIGSLKASLDALSQLPRLESVDLGANPCATGPSYRHWLVASLPELVTLDGDSITTLDRERADNFLTEVRRCTQPRSPQPRRNAVIIESWAAIIESWAAIAEPRPRAQHPTRPVTAPCWLAPSARVAHRRPSRVTPRAVAGQLHVGRGRLEWISFAWRAPKTAGTSPRRALCVRIISSTGAPPLRPLGGAARRFQAAARRPPKPIPTTAALSSTSWAPTSAAARG